MKMNSKQKGYRQFFKEMIDLLLTTFAKVKQFDEKTEW